MWQRWEFKKKLRTRDHHHKGLMTKLADTESGNNEEKKETPNKRPATFSLS